MCQLWVLHVVIKRQFFYIFSCKHIDYNLADRRRGDLSSYWPNWPISRGDRQKKIGCRHGV